MTSILLALYLVCIVPTTNYSPPVYQPVTVYYTEPRPQTCELTEDELEALTRLVYLEAGADWISDYCVRCVTDVAFNQLESGFFGNTMYEVLSHPGNYDETFPYIWNTEPNERVRQIVLDVYYNGVCLPKRIIFYRRDYFHWYAISEFATDNVYFSSSRYYQ